MATEGINAGQNAPKPMYDEKYLNDAKPKDEVNSQSLFNALWDEAARLLDEEADANGDGTVDARDLPLLNKLILNLQKGQQILAKNMSKYKYFDASKFKKGFAACEKSLKEVIDNIASGKYISPKKTMEKLAKERAEKAEQSKQAEQASLEPTETDAQSVKPKTEEIEITAQTLRIPDRKFMSLSDNKKECEGILKEYKKCLDNSYNSNRKIASNLKCFQAKYEEKLKTVASSIDNDGEYLLKNLYDQIESQIRYYSDLADKDAEKNQENMINSMAYIPSNPSAGNIAAAKKPEGPDPRADWAKIVNPD